MLQIGELAGLQSPESQPTSQPTPTTLIAHTPTPQVPPTPPPRRTRRKTPTAPNPEDTRLSSGNRGEGMGRTDLVDASREGRDVRGRRHRHSPTTACSMDVATMRSRPEIRRFAGSRPHAGRGRQVDSSSLHEPPWLVRPSSAPPAPRLQAPPSPGPSWPCCAYRR